MLTKRIVGFLLVIALLNLASGVAGAASSRDTLSVDVRQIQVADARSRVGVNLDYLMDDDMNRAAGARPLADGLGDLGVRVLRYPGGEKSDTNLWSTPPYTAPAPALARTGTDEWPSGDSRLVLPDRRTFRIDPLDFDEYLALCAAVGAEPLVVVPFDSAFKPAEAGGSAPTLDQLRDAAVAWVRYSAGRVRYWEIGNESYLGSWNGAPTRQQYIDGVIAFSRAMKAVDPTIKIGVNGRDKSWWQAVLKQASPDIDFLSVHNYPVWQWSGGYESYRTSSSSLAALAEVATKAITAYAPQADRDRLFVAVTEVNAIDYGEPGWGSANDLGHALVLTDVLAQQVAQPRVRFSLVWNTRWVSQDGALTDMLSSANRPTTAGRALALFTHALHDQLVKVQSSTLIHLTASYDPASGELTLVLLNKDTTARRALINVRNYTPRSSSVARVRYGGTTPEDTAPPLATLSALTTNGKQIDATLDPVSLTVLTLTGQRN